MLRAFLMLLAIVTDYETVTGIARCAFTLAVVNASMLGCVGACVAMRHWLASRNRANGGAARRMDYATLSYLQ